MRPTRLAMVVVLLVGTCSVGRAKAEGESRWWPFGGKKTIEATDLPPADPPEESTLATPSQKEPAAPPSQIEPAAPQAEIMAPDEEESDEHWMIDSPLAKVSWPSFHLPKMPKPKMPMAQARPKKSEVESDRNSWAEDDITPMRSSPWQSMSNGARRVGKGTRAAWGKTVEALTPGSSPPSNSSRVARQPVRPPWWKRMFAVEESQPEGPQTVTEWMAQERLDP
jgi:hypothetical protein